MFKITDSWLRKHTRGGRGMPTSEQIELFGLSYPLSVGWKDSLIGRDITEELKTRFEQLGDARENEFLADSARHEEMAEAVYYTCPDGKGSWVGRWLKPEEVGTWPGPPM